MPVFTSAKDPRVKTCNTESKQTVNNSTTLVNVTGLSISSLKANTRYAMTGILRVNSGTTPDIKIGWTLPSGTAIDWRNAGGSSELANPAAIATTGSAQILGLWGHISIGATAGSMQLQFAQNTQDASDTDIDAGSWIKLVELPGGAG